MHFCRQLCISAVCWQSSANHTKFSKFSNTLERFDQTKKPWIYISAGKTTEMNFKGIWKKLVKLAEEHFCLLILFAALPQLSRNGFVLLYVAKWMSYYVLNIEFLKSLLFLCDILGEIDFREVYRKYWHYFVWPKQICCYKNM